MYNIKLEVFEGPFDLLVYLIERSEMNIYDINIFEITEQYIEYVNKMKELDIELSSEFLVLAATLILIKSRMLLPKAPVSDDEQAEEEEEEDPRAALVERLLEYKKCKEQAAILEIMLGDGSRVYTKPGEEIKFSSDPDALSVEEIDMKDFLKVFYDFVTRINRIEEVKNRYSRLERERMTLEDKMAYMLKSIRGGGYVPLFELIDEKTDTYDVVLTFLSLLELMRTSDVAAEQEENFGEIVLKMNGRHDEGDLSYD